MAFDYSTQQGFLDLQLRVSKALTALAREKGVWLMDVTWMDGMSLPTRGGPVSLRIRQSSGEEESVTLDGAEVTAWLDDRWSSMDRKLGQALNTLKTRRPR